MIYLVTGASGSGKSEYAEALSVRLAEKKKREKLYLATMDGQSAQARKRIMRHRKLREGKNFITIEAPFGDLDEALLPANKPVILLEDVSNLLANLIFMQSLLADDARKRAIAQIERLKELSTDLILVTNEIFSDGTLYGAETEAYRRTLAAVNKALLSCSQVCCEIVYTIPVFWKGEALCQ